MVGKSAKRFGYEEIRKGEAMSEISDRYEGGFISGLDLPEGTEFKVEIDTITPPGAEQDSTGKVIEEAILGFRTARKRLILNATNWKVLVAMHGKDDSKWIGKTVTLQRRYLREFMGQTNVLCIRVIPPKGTSIPMGAYRFMGSDKPWKL